MKRLAIIGTGDFGEDVKLMAIKCGYEPIGYFDDLKEKGSIMFNLPILGKTVELIKKYEEGVFDYAFIAIGYKHFEIKENVYNIIKGKIPLANIISEKAIVDPSAVLGEGILITDEAYIARESVIGDNTSITLRSIINHGVRVGKHCFFSTNVTTAGNIKIGNRCFIGVGTVISDGVTICDDVWLSPGIVVGKDIEKPGKYMSYAMKYVKI